ncbi:ATP phosphoribosyltransferase regulatory subunit [Aureimonas fodinaquatilis]|uniref:ATP phosphoribosyltransferase regulatory subunit n=1 Tax=Aureimonas fodinaquatilis TaxID=2565783 RepID=A0A5B0DYM3_9HYPH|nr:ATP phosphoribosyltransferase regulatory subunit [Aureimonas fodinaquatilis]KAA0971884.1 ATP phosphoribosyltransferase regulatory subunit [Aureimonas fodinaquatilis]
MSERSSAALPFAAALADLFARSDTRSVNVPILQPADPYLDTAGEALRRRIFLTRGEDGRGLCLRPDFTIPVALSHIQAGAGLPRRYSYDGMVFRQSGEGATELRQAGIEDLGETDTAMADARALDDALRCISVCGVSTEQTEAVLGDQALFEHFLKSLGLPAGWQRRLIRTFGHDDLLRQAMEALASGAGKVSVENLAPDLHRLASAGEFEELAENIRDRMIEGGLPFQRSRTPEEIASRLIEKVAMAHTQLDRVVLERLRAFLSIDCALDKGEEALLLLARESGADMGASIAAFAARNAALEQAGVNLHAIRYRAAFGRQLDYYTGMVFEITAAGGQEVLAGGGRYDRLVSYLGAREAIPAVGFALWPSRIAAVTGAA